MRSLEEREAARAKRREAEHKERTTSPVQAIGGDKFEKGTDPFKARTDADPNAPPTANNNTVGGLSGGQQVQAFDAKDWLNDSVENIKSELSGLSNDELLAIEAEEKKGKNRAGVNDAVSVEKKKREGAGASWGANK